MKGGEGTAQGGKKNVEYDDNNDTGRTVLPENEFLLLASSNLSRDIIDTSTRRPYFKRRISSAFKCTELKRLTTLKTLRIITLQYFAHFFFAPSSVTLQNQFSNQSQSWIKSCMYIKVVDHTGD